METEKLNAVLKNDLIGKRVKVKQNREYGKRISIAEITGAKAVNEPNENGYDLELLLSVPKISEYAIRIKEKDLSNFFKGEAVPGNIDHYMLTLTEQPELDVTLPYAPSTAEKERRTWELAKELLIANHFIEDAYKITEYAYAMVDRYCDFIRKLEERY